MRVWWIGTAILVVIGLGVAGYAILGPGFAAQTQVQYLSATASVADVEAQVVATGTLQPAAPLARIRQPGGGDGGFGLRGLERERSAASTGNSSSMS
jgi:multidrug efflux pump subunit AcrA (membrane-fusion protein)